MRIQVLVVSEIRFFREGLANSLGGEEALEILDAVSPDAVAATIRHRRPDVVLLHVSIPSGPRLARTIAAVVPRVGMIALAVEEDECSIVAWAEAGVAGYIPPDGSLTQVADAARLVSQGGAACTPHAAAVIVRRISRLAPGPPPRNLTTREVEIAGLVEEGLSNKEIGRALSISLPTVKNHVHNILDKLQVDRRSRISVRSGSLYPL